MVTLNAGDLLLAFLITLLEMTEVVALVFALRAEEGSVRHGALGAVAGTGVVAGIALGAGAAILALPTNYLLIAAAITLYAFGVFLFRSTRRSYRKLWHPVTAPAAPATADRDHRAVQFGGGFTVGAVESTETVIVLLSLAAAGAGSEAVLGGLAGGAVLVGLALALHERIRKIKVPWLKLGATSMLFTFAVFWTGEVLGVAWPGADLSLLPLFVVALLFLRPAVGWLEGDPAMRFEVNR